MRRETFPLSGCAKVRQAKNIRVLDPSSFLSMIRGTRGQNLARFPQLLFDMILDFIVTRKVLSFSVTQHQVDHLKKG